MTLQIKNLHVITGNTYIVKGVNFELQKGEVIALMGPNGSGKSTLANTIMSHPKYTITKGKIILDGEEITNLTPDKKARLGLFLSMQHPPEIPGVTVANFLRRAKNNFLSKDISPMEFKKGLDKQLEKLQIDPSFSARHLNKGFSGGEKKKAEILQLAMLAPTYALLDETDSGLDVDALKIVASGINKFKSKDKGILLITHYNRILEYVVPDKVLIMRNGKIIKTGGKGLAKEIENNGYQNFI
jgi:Fe-S cluster assembly ATP-binding protein